MFQFPGKKHLSIAKRKRPEAVLQEIATSRFESLLTRKLLKFSIKDHINK